jgi:NAD(P)-dependent dehydrogenase (short-subunit alcohol dehydrogenase family)
MSTGVEGRVAVVTGATGGLGAEIGACLHERGDRVTLVARDTEALGATVTARGDRAHAVAADLAETDACDRVISETVKRWGRIDVLVNAAAILRRQEFEEVTEQSMAEIVNVNFRAVFWLCRAAMSDMERRRWGRIVNVTSVGVHTGGYSISSAVYESTKGAVANLTKTLCRYGSERGILVNSVAPGAMRTRMLNAETPPEVLAELERDIPLERIAEPREVAEVVAFLASDRNTYVTGAAIDVNGGMALG